MKKPFISLELFKSKRIDMRNEHYHPDGQKVYEHYQSSQMVKKFMFQL